MIWRYILAFILSIVLMFGWQVYLAGKREKNKQEDPQGQGAKRKADPGAIAAGEPAAGAAGVDKPADIAASGEKPAVVGGEKPAEEKPGPVAKPSGFQVAWKDDLGSLNSVSKDGTELASFAVSGSGLELSVAEGAGWRKIDSGWKAVEGASGPGSTHEVEAGKLKITRQVSAAVTGDGILRLDVALGFENKGDAAVRYRLGGGMGPGVSYVAVSGVRVKGEEQRAFVKSQSPVAEKGALSRRAGDAQWVALRRQSKIAVLLSKDADHAVASLVDAAGVSLEGQPVAVGSSQHNYQLAIGGNDPKALVSYGVKGDLARINQSAIKLSEELQVVVDSGRGALSEVSLLNHFTAVKSAPEREIQPVLLDSGAGAVLLSMGPSGNAKEIWDGAWKETITEVAGGKEVVFEKQVGSVLIRKKISPAVADDFDDLLGEGVGELAGGYLLRVRIELINKGDVGQDFPFMLYGPCGLSSSASSSRSAGRDIQLAFGEYGARKGVLSEILDIGDDRNLDNPRDVAWLATVNSYFTALIFPLIRGNEEDGAQGIHVEEIPYPSRGWWPIAGDEVPDEIMSLRTGLKCAIHLPSGGIPQELEFGLYIGARVSDFIEAGTKLEFEGANDFGVTSSLIHFFMGVLDLLQKITLGNWGLAIILLTVLVKICLHPVTRKNQRGMMRMGKVMAKIKPEMEALKEKYADDKLKHSQEVQKLWRKHNVNPAKQMLGCLVIFLQMPIWIGIIWSLDFSIGLRQASFIYMEDLTKPDKLFPFPFTIPLLGEYFNLLPVLYVVLTLVNQRMQPRSEDPQAAAQQKMMGFMMIFFGFIFYKFAAGFMLYIMTSAALGIAESKIIKAQLAREEPDTGGEAGGLAATEVAAGPLYTTKKKSAEKSVVPSSSKKKKRRKRR